MENTVVLEDILKDEFNLPHFRLGQKEIIMDIMNGKDVLGILPTGTGKSLCYQLPAKLLDGLTIVVSPLIALMLDQVKQLKATNFKNVIALNSFMHWKERKKTYENLHSYKLIYISPELLQNEELLTHLADVKVSLFVIDEAHCISQWGHEFRPDYLKLASVIKRLGNPPLLALSATATESVQQDIVTALNRPEITKHIYPIDRENIALNIQRVDNNEQKNKIITNILSHIRVPTIIYFSSRQTTETITSDLKARLPDQRIAFYHGGMDQRDRLIVQQQFTNDQLDIICCTSAFGMGINKSNIRLIIHYHLPSQIESYIQEVGRAGRDGNESVGLLLFNKHDIFIPKSLINKELPTESMLKTVFNKLYELYKDEQTIPSTPDKIEETLGINETQWRVIQYQLEKHGIIKESTIYYDSKKWQDTFKKVIALQKERYNYKHDKLNEMVDWIKHDQCLREKLYKPFQPSFTPARYQCCTNCGFSFKDWNPTPMTKQSQQTKWSSWQEKLKELLLIEGKNETK